MKQLLLLIFLFAVSFRSSNAQTKSFILPLAATVNAGEVHDEWNPVLQENEEVRDEHYRNDQLSELKRQLLLQMHPSGKKSSLSRDLIDTPYVWESLQAQNFNGSVPNDNDIAVSNTGYIISVMNTNLFKYKLTNDSSLGITSLESFSAPLANYQGKYDPKVIYDPDQNKFIVVFLAGFSSDSTYIIVAFSQSDNPNGAWNLYQLPGNPLNDSLWSDYPAIALTNQELFITVNHLVDTGSWQTAWRRTVIWQVNKFGGFNGNSLSTQLHYDIGFGGKGIRNLCPVKGGSHLYGADMYFLSDRNLDIANDTFFLVHLTDTINAPSQMLTVQALVSDVPYFVPISAKQPFIHDLATNDARVLGAFFENDRIQFAGNTTDTVLGNAAMYHGVITNVTSAPAVSLRIISSDTVCYGYPNISYAGNGSADNTAIINVLQSGTNLFPGSSALVTDGNGSYSPVKTLKDGLSYHMALAGEERWGDYTGSQRDYTSPGLVWVNGSYARLSHLMSTWISQVGLLPPPSNVPSVKDVKPLINLYPNPSFQDVVIEFEVESYAMCRFEIHDLQGRLVKLLMNEKVSPGKNKFSFSASSLPAGEYILQISSKEEWITSEKFVKQ